jgi:hypothetical protein
VSNKIPSEAAPFLGEDHRLAPSPGGGLGREGVGGRAVGQKAAEAMRRS